MQGHTADFRTSRDLRQIIASEGNTDDIVSFLQERNLPVDEIEARNVAKTILPKSFLLNRRHKVTSLSQRTVMTDAVSWGNKAGTLDGLAVDGLERMC
ncbi:hypothetical protein [Sodalis sp.]|uniref:hypothetical protein n=1 Tax=Sodalis sp. (in: enterobacteria) TaxID=1898979 RepID=UPI003873B043